MEEELWIRSREDPNYLISSEGRVYNKISDKYIKPWITSNGYLQVELYSPNHRRVVYLHRAVYGSFNSIFDSNTILRFVDGNKLNCRLDNIEAMSFDFQDVSEVDSYRLKGRPVFIEELGLAFGNAYQAAEAIGADPDNIRKCLIGERRRHMGLTFRYLDV